MKHQARSTLKHDTPPGHVPGEIIFFVEHSEGCLKGRLTSGALVELLHAHGLPNLPSGFEDRAALSMARAAHGDRSRLSVFVLRWADAVGEAEISAAYREQLSAHPDGMPLRDTAAGDDAVGFLRYSLLNYYAAAATHIGIGSHGPGRMPRPVTDAQAQNAQFTGFDAFGSLAPVAEDVDVYILDTIPPLDQISEAWTKWGTPGTETLKTYAEILTPKVNPTYSKPNIYETDKAVYVYAAALGTNFQLNHDLQEEYAEPNGPRIPVKSWRQHCNTPEDLASIPFGIEDKYVTNDHGLFVTGLIHKIAQQAQLYVLEVLNKYGIGSMLNLIAAVMWIHEHRQLQNDPSRKVIINASLTPEFPTGDEEITQAFKGILSEILEDAWLVTAAGNDSITSPASEPSNLLTTSGSMTVVGALDKNNARAEYSNVPAPFHKGVFIFGGNYTDCAPPSPEDKGLISIYTHSHFYPPDVSLGTGPKDVSDVGVLNTNGYAEWAGTSFAAAVLTGTLAKLCLSGKTLYQAVGAVQGQSEDVGNDKGVMGIKGIKQVDAASVGGS